MNLKEALSVISHLEGHEEFDKLRSFLQSQQKEIERLKSGATALKAILTEVVISEYTNQESVQKIGENILAWINDNLDGDDTDLEKYSVYEDSEAGDLEDEIERLQNKYKRVCPKCEGLGMDNVDPEAPTKGKTRCRICKGTGRIPRCVLPDWFVIWLQYLNDFELKSETEICLEDKYGENVNIKFTLTKTPDGWELESAE